jgi:hypothetical protein
VSYSRSCFFSRRANLAAEEVFEQKGRHIRGVGGTDMFDRLGDGE